MLINISKIQTNAKLRILIVGILYFVFSFSARAQCAMCRAALGGEQNTKQAEAVNEGIVYLMVVPYLLVAIIGVFIYKMYQNKKSK